ncbi:MAG: site-specific integrase [Methanobrevibacter sp.]|nr:site-specific integrase [Methanosphaera sp.]MBR0369188.1 site-specific integrase [Methanobrevibacter sp.]
MIEETDELLIKEISISRNLSERTELLYRLVLRKYIKFNKMSLTEMLKEAEKEEDEQIPWKRRTIRKRLLNFRTYLYNNYMLSTAKMNFSKILTVYKHFEIELHELPTISEKQAEESIIRYNDLPTKEEIREALKITTPMHRAIILFFSSSGCASAETLGLTISDFIKSVEEYYKSDDIYEIIHNLYGRDDVVPCFEIKRRKTGKVYYAFCSPEAFNEICSYLLTRKGLRNSDRLFKVTQLHLMQLFRDVNNTLGLGTVGKNNYVKFRAHMLRKFHASTLYNAGMTLDTVNDLQGKSKNKTDSSYFMEDPAKLKAKYMEHMGALTINLEVKHLDVKTVEFVRLENELVRKTEEVSNLTSRMDVLEKIVSDNLSDEEVKVIDKYF